MLKVIANPPYCGNLFLKIMKEVLQYSDDIVCLAPVRWLRDPLAAYKKNSEWNRFKYIRAHIKSLDVVSKDDANTLFIIWLYTDLGVHHLTKEGGLNVNPKPFISQGLFDKVNLPTYQGKYKSLQDMRSPDGKPNISKYFVKFSVLHSGAGTKEWYNIINPHKEITFTEKVVKGAGTGQATINFDTEEERDNFFTYCQTKFVRACNGNVKTCIRWPGHAILFMPTYEHEWTDEMLYKYFNLTSDEIDEIEKVIE